MTHSDLRIRTARRLVFVRFQRSPSVHSDRLVDNLASVTNVTLPTNEGQARLLMGLEPNFCFHTPSCDRIVPCLKPVTSPASTAALNVLITDHPIT